MSRRKAKPMSGEPTDLWCTIKEAAVIRRVHPITMLLYCQQGVVRAEKFGGRWRVYKPLLIAPPGEAPADIPVERRKRGRPPKKRVA